MAVLGLAGSSDPLDADVNSPGITLITKLSQTKAAKSEGKECLND